MDHLQHVLSQLPDRNCWGPDVRGYRKGWGKRSEIEARAGRDLYVIDVHAAQLGVSKVAFEAFTACAKAEGIEMKPTPRTDVERRNRVVRTQVND